ncbi:3833_t:CDS:2 [Gigaspora margarita]|uniref:3833_t:CDS:1 n=1 Tax=Gigaspora margarita TaxID=4874 RepID=A0ABN7UIT5_GIGMA|nr:3833_t:CDS:2 [Gigaspora margarita]
MIDVGFPLTKGRALKGNQKLDNRGGTRIKRDVKSISKERMSAKAMHCELLEYAKSGEIKREDVLKIQIIQNWLNSYAQIFKKRATEHELELANK